MSRRHIFLHIFAIVFLVCAGSVTSAADLESSSFIIRDLVISGGGGNGTSTSYEMLYSTDLVVTGTSSSASFEGRYGFLNFPVVTSPTLSVVAGDTQALLSWTPASASLGFTVSGYAVGIASVSGGPYTFTSVGTTLAHTQTGLTNGETYYFVIRVLDAFGDPITLSSEVSITLPDSGGGDDDETSQQSSSRSGGMHASFFGYAHPGGIVRVLKDGSLASEVSVNVDGEFSVRVNDLMIGSYLFTLYGVDPQGVRSGLLTLPISFTTGASFSSTRIFIPPTLSFDDESSSDALSLSGVTVPGASVAVVLTDGSRTVAVQNALSGTDGRYHVVFPQSVSGDGLALRSLASVGALQSPFGTALHMVNIHLAVYKGDFNNDNKVNLVDFSILAYWHGRTDVPKNLDLNGDAIISLTDFSILTFYWTG